MLYRGRSHTLRALWLVVFGDLLPLTLFNIFTSVRAFYPLGVLYCTQAGMSLSQVGIVYSAAAGIHIVVDMPLSLMADKLGNHHLMFRLGSAITAAAYTVLCVYAHRASFALVLCCMTAQGFGGALVYGTKEAYGRLRIDGLKPQDGAMEYEVYESLKGLASWIVQALILGTLLALTRGWPAIAPLMGCGLQAVAAVGAMLTTLWIPRLSSEHQEARLRRAPIRQAERRFWPLLAFGAFMVGISNAQPALIPYLSRQNGGGASFVLLSMMAFWLSAATASALTMAYERRLGSAKAMMGLAVLAGVGLLIFGFAPGMWFLSGVIACGILTGWCFPVLSVRLTHGATLPATAISAIFTGGLVIVTFTSLTIGWMSEHVSTNAASLVIFAVLVPPAALCGWMARRVPRGWPE